MTEDDLIVEPELTAEELEEVEDLEDVEFVSETALTIRGSRRRTTIPKEIVEKVGLKDKDRIRWVLTKDKEIFIFKVKN